MTGVLFLLTLLACDREPSSCDEAACDQEVSYCILYGSDTMAPSVATCEPLPEACGAAADCDCLLVEHPDIAVCEPDGDGVSIVIPGG